MTNALFGAIVGLIAISTALNMFKDALIMHYTLYMSQRASKKQFTELFGSDETFDDSMNDVLDLKTFQPSILK